MVGLTSFKIHKKSLVCRLTIRIATRVLALSIFDEKMLMQFYYSFQVSINTERFSGTGTDKSLVNNSSKCRKPPIVTCPFANKYEVLASINVTDANNSSADVYHSVHTERHSQDSVYKCTKTKPIQNNHALQVSIANKNTSCYLAK